MNTPTTTKVCYLVNQYPKISHTFIRREILGLEAAGAEVARVSIREVGEVLVDDIDVQEQRRTQFIVSGPRLATARRLVVAALLCLPRMIPALPVWWRVARSGPAGVIKHLFYLLEACWLFRYCSSHGIAHVHAHFGTNPAAVALFCRLLGGPPYSFTVHGPEEFDSPKALSLKEKVHFSKFTVAISSYCKSQLCRWSDFDDWAKIVEVHCAVDEGVLQSANNPITNARRFVTIGRLCEQKGQVVLLEAMRQLVPRYPDLQLHIVGDGEYRAYFEAFIAEHGLQNNVVLHGWQGSDFICDQLDQSVAMVLPSFAEGLPVVIMEAFARRRPVIATYIAAIPELVTAQSGWLAPAGHVAKLAAAMEEAMLMPIDELEHKGNQGYLAVRERHHADTEAKKLYQFVVTP